MKISTCSFDVLEESSIKHTGNLIGEIGGLDMAIYCSGISGTNPSLCHRIEQDVVAIHVVAFTRLADFFYSYFSGKGYGQLATIGSSK